MSAVRQPAARPTTPADRARELIALCRARRRGPLPAWKIIEKPLGLLVENLSAILEEHIASLEAKHPKGAEAYDPTARAMWRAPAPPFDPSRDPVACQLATLIGIVEDFEASHA